MTQIEATGDQQLKSILKSPKDRGLSSNVVRSPNKANESPEAKNRVGSAGKSNS